MKRLNLKTYNEASIIRAALTALIEREKSLMGDFLERNPESFISVRVKCAETLLVKTQKICEKLAWETELMKKV